MNPEITLRIDENNLWNSDQKVKIRFNQSFFDLSNQEKLKYFGLFVDKILYEADCTKQLINTAHNDKIKELEEQLKHKKGE